jgi:hypothetical protein
MKEPPGLEMAPAPVQCKEASEDISCKHARIQSVTKETHEGREREN